MTTLTHAQVLGFALAVGFDRATANVITVIANYESGDNPNSRGDLTLSKYGSIGLTQDFTGAHSPSELHLGSGAWTPALVALLEDPLTNMRAAKIIYGEQGFKAWSTYNNLHSTPAWASLLSAVSHLVPVMPGAPVPPVPPKVVPVTTPILKAQHESLHPTQNWHDRCLVFVRTMFGIAADGREPTAYSSWIEAGGSKGVNTHTKLAAPANVPVYYKGSNPAGHIALSAGHGMVWSSDIIRDGKIDLTSSQHIEAKWGMKYLGWAEVLESVRIIAHVKS